MNRSIVNKARTGFVAMLALMLTLVSVASAAPASSTTAVSLYYVPMKFTFGGVQYQPPAGQQGFIYKGSSYVPLRFASYALGQAVNWDASANTVSVYNPSKTEQVAIQEYKLNMQVHGPSKNGQTASSKATKVQAGMQKLRYLFNGVQKQPSADLPGLVIKDTLYVPIRFFSESVGRKIDWIAATYTVSVAGSTDGSATAGKPAGGGSNGGTGGGSGMTSGGGAGGGGAQKPSYEALTSAAETKLYELKDRSMNELTALANEYIKTGDTALIAEGLSDLSGYDAEFETIVGQLEKDLKANGYSTDIIQTYRDTYEQIKAEQQQKVAEQIAAS